MKKLFSFLFVLFFVVLLGFKLYSQTSAAAPTNTTSVIDYRQCANGTGTDTGCIDGWINGILHNPNSHYQEDQSVPQRLVLSVDSGATTGRTITFRYETRKNGVHAYDSMSTWNLTQTSADRCLGLSGSDCIADPPSTWPIPLDPTVVYPFTSGSGVTSDYQITPGDLVMYGGTITNISVPVHDNAASAAGDDYATVTITYDVNSLTLPTKVMLLWGGHTAATDGSRGWGVGLGSGNVSGGPYHFKLDKTDGTSIGSRDNQLQGASLEIPPTVTTTIHDAAHATVTSVPAGTTVHDSVSVTGSAGTVTGEVTFDFFTNGTCSQTPAATSDIFTLSGGAADATTFAQGPLSAGSYSFMAHYTGDKNYSPGDGACEPLTVTQLTPSVTTDIHTANHDVVTSVDLGSTVHDQATVGGAFTTPSGTVGFRFFTNNTCEGEGVSAGNVSLVDGVAHPSSSEGPLAAGSYSFKAHYNGDTNYVAGDASCEPLTVNKGTPTVTTELHNSDETVITTDASTSTVHDSATVSGIQAFSPSGSVDFTFYTNNQCEGEGTVAGTAIALVDGLAHPSTAQGPLSHGLYAFKAHYNGDDNYNTAGSDCEPFSVTTLEVKKILNPTNDPGLFNLQIDTVTKKTDATNNDTTDPVIVTAGAHAVSEVAGANTDLTNYQGVTGGDCAIDGTITLTAGTAKLCTITNTHKGKITIVKDATPNDLQDFAFGGTLGAFSLDDDAAVSGSDDVLGNSKLFDKLTTGTDYVFTETEPNVYWTSTGITCDTGTYNVSGTTLTVTNLQPRANVTCTFNNLKLAATRTLGFWQTHTSFTTSVFTTHPFTIGNNGSHKGPLGVADANKVFGGFYANIAKKSDGKTKRSATDQARMILLQQLLAAKLNCAEFGCPASVSTLIAQADAAYAAGSSNMTSLAAQLDTYNNSGDTIVIFPAPGNATPALSKGIADIQFWDQP